MKRKIILLLFMITICSPLFSKSIFDDMINNDIHTFRDKMDLLEIDYSEYPLIANYLRYAQQIEMGMVEFLVENGAEINKQDSYSVYPIHYAILRCDDNIIEYLIDNGADLDSYSSLGNLIKLSYYTKEHSINIDNSYQVNSKQFAVFTGKYDLIKKYWPEYNGADKIPLESSSIPGLEQISYLELPLWSERYKGDISEESIKIFRYLWKNNEDVILPNYYNSLLKSVLTNNTSLLKETLFYTIEDSKDYILYSLMSESYDTLDLLLKFNGMDYSSSAPFRFSKSIKLDEYSAIDNLEIQYNSEIPLYVYPLVTGNSEMLNYLINQEADLSRKFKARSFDSRADVYKQYSFSGDNLISISVESSISDIINRRYE